MLFLGIITDLIGNLGDVIDRFLGWLFFFLAELIYPFISYLYELFLVLIKGRLLDNEIMQVLANRVGLLLGIVMFFILIISTIQMLVDPDKATDKEKGVGSIIVRVIVVIVMFGLSSFVFESLYYVQEVVVESDVIGKLLIPYEVKDDDFGDYLSYTLFTSFYRVEPSLKDSNIESVKTCISDIEQLKDDVYDRQDYSVARNCLWAEAELDDGEVVRIIDFNFLLMMGTGVFVVYFLFTYCVSIGIRMVQLTFLEIISPMAFVSYLSPKKDNMFSKWLKIYSSTFIDSFLRIAIINLAVFLISMILGEMAEGSEFLKTVINTEFVNNNDWTLMLIYVIMIFAILSFAKKAPELIKELFPSGASRLGLGVTSPKQLFDGMLGGNLVKTGAKAATAGAAIGLLGSTLSGISRYNSNRNLGRSRLSSFGSAAFGAVTGFGRGMYAGSKNGGFFKNLSGAIKEQEKIDDKYMDLISRGGSTYGMMKAKALDLVTETDGQRDRRRITNMNNLAKFTSDAKAAADNMNFVKSAKDAWENAVQMENETREEFIARKEKYGEQYRQLRNAAMKFALSKGPDGERDMSLLDFEYVSYVTEKQKVQKYDSSGRPLIGQYEEKEVTKEVINKGNYYEQMKDDYDSQLAIRQIENYVEGAKQYSQDNSVEYWDEGSKKFKKFTKEFFEGDEGFGNFKSLGDMAKDTEFKIISSGDYGKNQANEEAAGVSDRRKPYERK